MYNAHYVIVRDNEYYMTGNSVVSRHDLFFPFLQLTEEAEKNVTKSREVLDGIVRENKGTTEPIIAV